MSRSPGGRIRAAILAIGIGFAVFLAWEPTIDATTYVEPVTPADARVSSIFGRAIPPVVHVPRERLRPFRPLTVVAVFTIAGLLLVPRSVRDAKS